MSHAFVWAASLRILLAGRGRWRTRDRLALIAFRGPLNTDEAAVCGAEVFDDFIGLSFQRGIGATRGRASQTATPRTQTCEHQGIALSPAPVWYAREGAAAAPLSLLPFF